MTIEKIPPSVRQVSSEAYPTQPTGHPAPSANKTGQAVKTIFENPIDLSAERAFVRTPTLKEDLGPLTERISHLASSAHLLTPVEIKGEIERCKKGLQGLCENLESLEFEVAFPLMNELKPRQAGSFASYMFNSAKKTLAGEKSDVRHTE